MNSTTGTSPATSPATRTVTLPSATMLLAAVFGICTLGQLAWYAGRIAFTDVDPHAEDGPVESIITLGIMGPVALLICVGAGYALSRRTESARVGAGVLVVLALLGVPAFWAGLPAFFGVTAAWLAGLTRGATPLGGTARVMGLVGIFLAFANCVLLVLAIASEGW